MNRRAALALAAGATLLPMLGGCVAAAIPLAAGAVLARSQMDGDGADRRTAAGRPAPAAPIPETGTPPSPAPAVTIVPLSALPPPTAARPANPAVATMSEYVLAQAALPPGPAKRASALLAAPGDLNSRRAVCTGGPAAIFVDLDPGRGAFDPLSPGTADPDLATALARLRAADVQIVWFSRLGDNFAPAVRAALASGGLDPAGDDTLVLMRDLAERKQSRRDDLAKAMCPVAILGDERADFDELYLYLRRPDAAVALDALIGRGWFLASPFAAAGEFDRPDLVTKDDPQ